MRYAVLLTFVAACAAEPQPVRAPVYELPPARPVPEAAQAAQLRALEAQVSAVADDLQDIADESCALLRAMDASVPPGECEP